MIVNMRFRQLFFTAFWTLFLNSAVAQTTDSPKSITFSENPEKALTNSSITLCSQAIVSATEDGSMAMFVVIANHSASDVFIGTDLSSYEIQRGEGIQLLGGIVTARRATNAYMFLPSSKSKNKLEIAQNHWSSVATVKLTKSSAASLKQLIEEKPQGIIVKTTIRWFDTTENRWFESRISLPIKPGNR